MEEEESVALDKPRGAESYYFELQASWGLTKHMGGYEATKELAEVCRIDKDSYVLDVGCGVGISACFLAKEFGCRVAGIDISEKMVEKSKKRARRKRFEDKVEFRVADAQNLPFKNELFDAVIGESVNVFLQDKQKAMSEYKRATKLGGHVGFNEVTWVETPPPELVEYLSLALGGAQFLTAEKWRSLLEKAGFKKIVAEIHRTTAWHQWANEVRQMDPQDYFGAWAKFFSLLLKSPEIRNWVKEISKPPKSIFKVFNYMGYGLYVGMK